MVEDNEQRIRNGILAYGLFMKMRNGTATVWTWKASAVRMIWATACC
ncbi:MAG: hypothetical protein R3E95_13270 [Thiolinea sp.]